MKFAILTMENVRTMVTVHDEALRDVKFKPAEDARIQVVQVTCFTCFTSTSFKFKPAEDARIQVVQITCF